ncbi:CbtB domain-containing protein [Arenibaculum sp.]|jgi:cobalt transporter subunit CbtB|uniref:CbtB domain-containing protein n=1 Tax=Arenibaculum sp. TaxID=2865862 RepID=UPI002E123641|nr:CbtB-domain containing protein [Arenibaculum sp.]
MTSNAKVSAPSTGTRAEAAAPAVLAILLGTFLIFGAGFAGSATLHDVAHDARHAFAFPCH